MTLTAVPFSSKDNARSQLDAGINASATSLSVQSGHGSRFPQPYSGSATSLGSTTLLNSTGISAAIGGSAAEGKLIWNKTDGSVARIKTVATHAVTTTRLIGGSDNTWQNSDVWSIDPFVITLAKVTTSAYGVDTITQQEQALITGRSTDNLTVATGGRGYNGTVANTFDADDWVYLFVTSPIPQRLTDLLAEVQQQVDTNTTSIANFSSTSNALGASLVGVEDAAGSYTGTTVETVLAEIATSLASTVTLSQMGFFGDGNDSSPTWTSGASLDPSTEKRYTTATLPVSQTLTVSSVNTPLIIHNSGAVIINGTVDLNGKGGPGGPNAANSSNASGSIATGGNSLISGFITNPGNGGTGGTNGGGGGGGGGSMFSAGSVGGNGSNGAGGAAGAIMSATYTAFLACFLRGVACGAGGGGGGNNTSGGAGDGDGGAGGGALVWYIGGNLTLGASSVIRCAGENGVNATGVAHSGGGGGGGGVILIIVAGTITNSGVTLTSSGGTGGTATSGGGDGGVGGAGANGKILIYSLSTGTLITG